jgi:hypothetical protein
MPQPVLTHAEEQTLAAMCRRHWIADVPAAFDALPKKGTKLRINTRDYFPDRPAYTKVPENALGGENHFQGFQRLLSGHHVAISGGDWRNRASHLFIGRLASRAGSNVFGSNMGDGRPSAADTIIARLNLHDTMWHAGGISLCGHVLAVPVECGPPQWHYAARGIDPPRCDNSRSAIYLVDVRQPSDPKTLIEPITRDDRKATAAALLHVPGTGYLLMVVSAAKADADDDVDDEDYRPVRMDFYWSNGEELSGGFSEPVEYRIPRDLIWASYQTINLVRETDGDVFMFGLTGKVADLFKVGMPSPGQPWTPSLEHVKGRKFDMDKNFTEFKAGAGFFSRDGTLALYGVPQWRRWDGLLGMTEWSPPRIV